MDERRPFAFLPVPDKYIKTPMSKDNRVAVVVPAYKEFENGNVVRLINTFASQTAPSSSFEVLCLVNNHLTDAQKETDVYNDNLRTLELARYINTDTPPPDTFSDHQKEVIQKARERRLSFHFINLTLGGVDGKMGVARQAGVIEAVKRFRANGNLDSGIIAHMDADTTVGARYVEQLITVFEDPQTEAAFLNFDYAVPSGSEELYKTTKKNELKFWCDRLQRVLAGRPIIGSPQIAATAAAHIKVGGMPLRHSQEDLVFADMLQEKTQVHIASDITVYSSDRARMESFDGRGRLLSMPFIDSASLQDPTPNVISNMLQTIRQEYGKSLPPDYLIWTTLSKCNSEVTPEMLSEVYAQNPDVSGFYQTLKQLIAGGTETVKKLTTAEYSEKMHTLVANWSTEEEKADLENFVAYETRKSKIRHAGRKKVVERIIKTYPNLTAEAQETIVQNPWMKVLLMTVNEEANDKDRLLVLKDAFPDLLGEWKTQLHGAIAKVKGVYLFALEQSQRENSAVASQLFKHFKTMIYIPE